MQNKCHLRKQILRFGLFKTVSIIGYILKYLLFLEIKMYFVFKCTYFKLNKRLPAQNFRCKIFDTYWEKN